MEKMTFYETIKIGFIRFLSIDPIFCHRPLLAFLYTISTKPFLFLSGRLHFGKVVHEGSSTMIIHLIAALKI